MQRKSLLWTVQSPETMQKAVSSCISSSNSNVYCTYTCSILEYYTDVPVISAVLILTNCPPFAKKQKQIYENFQLYSFASIVSVVNKFLLLVHKLTFALTGLVGSDTESSDTESSLSFGEKKIKNYLRFRHGDTVVQ